MSLSFNYRPDFYFSFAYQPQEKRVKTAKTEKCISSICKVNDPHEQEATKNFHRNEKKSYLIFCTRMNKPQEDAL